MKVTIRKIRGGIYAETWLVHFTNGTIQGSEGAATFAEAIRAADRCIRYEVKRQLVERYSWSPELGREVARALAVQP